MIIFTVTNKTTSQVYVGSTRNDLVDQWEKMVAAAEQNLEYPLYQEIRVHSKEGFVVEEWDYVDDRNELNALEQEALETLNAKSLRGYKTSTVKIQPKKKTRARKSSIEKELASIFSEVNTENDSVDMGIASPAPETKSEATPSEPGARIETNTHSERNAHSERKVGPNQPSASPAALPTAKQPGPALAKAPEEGRKEAAPLPENCSQANAVVQMNHISLSDDISAQLEAIQAAANAVLAGDSSAAEELGSFKAQTETLEKEKEDTKTAENESTESPSLSAAHSEIIIELNPREQRIREAIDRHRRARSQKSSDCQASEREQIARLLAELDSRAMNASQHNSPAVA